MPRQRDNVGYYIICLYNRCAPAPLNTETFKFVVFFGSLLCCRVVVVVQLKKRVPMALVYTLSHQTVPLKMLMLLS